MHVLLYMLAAHTFLEPAAVWQKKVKNDARKGECVCVQASFFNTTQPMLHFQNQASRNI